MEGLSCASDKDTEFEDRIEVINLKEIQSDARSL